MIPFVDISSISVVYVVKVIRTRSLKKQLHFPGIQYVKQELRRVAISKLWSMIEQRAPSSPKHPTFGVTRHRNQDAEPLLILWIQPDMVSFRLTIHDRAEM